MLYWIKLQESGVTPLHFVTRSCSVLFFIAPVSFLHSYLSLEAET